MGKIAGALLGMMMIGNNSTLQQAMGGGVAQQRPQTPTPEQQRKQPAQVQVAQPQQSFPVVHEPQEERAIIHRSR